MKRIASGNLLAAALMSALAVTTASAQQVPLPKTAAEVPGPASGNAMTREYVQMVGRLAYVWGYAMVNSHNRRAAFAFVTSQHGKVSGWNGGVLRMAPVGLNAMLTDYIKPELVAEIDRLGESPASTKETKS